MTGHDHQHATMSGAASTAQATATTNRGTIILDASTIFCLGHHINSKLLKPDHYPPLNTYLDLLPLLARNGFRILIPEVVAVEAGDMLADGRELRKNLDTERFDDKLRANFLKGVTRGEFPNISIIQKTGPERANAYCENLHIAVNLAQTSKNAHLQTMLKGIRTHSDTKDLGDRAIMAMVESEKYRQDDTPILVMTDDRDLAIQAERRGVQSVDTRTFLHNLVRSRLAPKMGLATQVNAADLFVDAYSKNENRAQDRKPWKISQLDGKITKAFLANIAASDKRPFARALVGLKKDIDTQAASVEASGNAASPPNSNGNGVVSQTDKFRARYRQRNNGTAEKEAATSGEGFAR